MTEKPVATYVLSLSIFSMAAALVYFTVQIGAISSQIPDILASVENTSEKIEPVVNEINQVRDLVPPILNEVEQTRKQIPIILEEVRQVREQVPPVLSELALLRENVPLILEEVKNTREHIPAIIDSTNKTADAVNNISVQIEKTRPLVPEVLTQVEITREAIPGMMDRAENLINQAKQAGKEASKGAVTGVLTGIVTAPFDILGSIGKTLLGISDEEAKRLSEQDVALMTKSARDLLLVDKIGTTKEWNNTENNHKGRSTLKSIDKFPDEHDDMNECREVHVQVWEAKKSILDKSVTLCMDNTGEWIRI